MLKRAAYTLILLIAAFGGGIWSAHWFLNSTEGIDRLNFQNWTAYPNSGTQTADPYAKARNARSGMLSLGSAEGLRFYAEKTSNNNKLKLGCTYRLSGKTMPARFWTLFAVTAQNTKIPMADGLQSAFHSSQIIYEKNGAFSIIISPQASGGNWLTNRGEGEYKLIMTFYDTPMATTTGTYDVVMPTIELLSSMDACRG